MSKTISFLYGIINYVIFLGVFLYAIAFVGDFLVPKTIDSGGPTGAFWPALLINAGLLGLFAFQHSGMARPGFKAWWTGIVPEPIERSTYVLFANATLILLFWQWRPLTDVVWSVEAAWGQYALWGMFGLGWTLVLISTFMISHWHLFGLKQVRKHMQGEELPGPEFQITGFYQYVRHPLNLGFIIAFWATPEMTVGHLVFALATTGYIFVAMVLEERDLIAQFGKRYRRYRERVPMIVPGLKRGTVPEEVPET
ncbi:MAG: isoprenylcysteine carboxylmethyltransferase family protein [Bacteroidetes bacterium]|jgi:protein-S-isoprenylcysteine O-methyltransferase Ste14|nr:isoprenylcysteine carboxylmethyltransferase family protein [Bacteroidota bacterium]